MKILFFISILFLLFFNSGFSQNTVNSQNYFSLPKVTTPPTTCLANEKGYMVYCTSDNKIYYCNGTTYQNLTGISSNFFSLDGYSIVSQGKVKLSGLSTNETSIQNKVLTAVDNFGTVEWGNAAGGGGSKGFSVTGAIPSSTGQTFTGNTATKLTILNIEDFDDANQFSTNSAFTASEPGMYHFDLKMNIFPVTVPVPEATVSIIQIRKNGANVRVSTQAVVMGGVDYNTSFNLKLATNDTIEIFAYTTAGYIMKIYGGTFLSFSGYKVY
ncbi:hypothetical protein [Emticicia sp.]|uniref:hypothetical protein n=1 Tax=Emticicia sp. TaxID=1930953 RepID=UPI003752C23F